MTDNTFAPPCYVAALEYIDKGLAVIPINDRSKVPATSAGLNDWTDNPEQCAYWWGQGDYENYPEADSSRGVGIVCGTVSGGVFVIDVDVHGDVNGLDTLKRWENEHGKLPETWTQITGSGGRQMFYRSTRQVHGTTNGKLGLDVKGDGGYVLAPPSMHPCGERYEWSISPDDCDIAMANDTVWALVDFIRDSGRNRPTDGYGERFELPERIDHDRNNTLFKYACSLRSTGRSAQEISVLLHSVNQTNCVEPLPENELLKIIGSVTRYEQGNAKAPHSPKKPAEKIKDETVEKLDSIYDRPKYPAEKIKDETVEKVRNVLLGFDEISRFLKFNVLDGRLNVLGPCIPGVRFERPHAITEGERVSLFTVLERDCGVRGRQHYEDALASFGSLDSQRFNPMESALNDLPIVQFDNPDTANCVQQIIRISYDNGETWETANGTAGTICTELLGVEPTDYNIEVERLMFRQLVARSIRPGCKADQMFVIVGRQGTGKSTFVRLLSLMPDFFLEGFSNFDNEDLRRIQGKLVVEIPELDGFDGRDRNRIKSIITQTSDTFREPYARAPVEHQRTAVFFGTTNDGAFLSDSTGGRRYAIIESKRDMGDADPRLFNGEAARLIRLAYAETYALYRLWGEEAFFHSLTLPRSVRSESNLVQARFSEDNVFEDAVNAFLEDAAARGITRVNVRMVFEDGMKYTSQRYFDAPKFQKQAVQMALDNAPNWTLMNGKQRVTGYGISKAWEFNGFTGD